VYLIIDSFRNMGVFRPVLGETNENYRGQFLKEQREATNTSWTCLSNAGK
jgi:hypothetical protein